jgi:hypothetical protein
MAMEQEDILDPILLEERKKPKRPVVITVICILYFVFIALIIPALVNRTSSFKNLAFIMACSWKLTANIIPSICSVVLLFQLKKMKDDEEP